MRSKVLRHRDQRHARLPRVAYAVESERRPQRTSLRNTSSRTYWRVENGYGAELRGRRPNVYGTSWSPAPVPSSDSIGVCTDSGFIVLPFCTQDATHRTNGRQRCVPPSRKNPEIRARTWSFSPMPPFVDGWDSVKRYRDVPGGEKLTQRAALWEQVVSHTEAARCLLAAWLEPVEVEPQGAALA